MPSSLSHWQENKDQKSDNRIKFFLSFLPSLLAVYISTAKIDISLVQVDSRVTGQLSKTDSSS
jgi:hypothetical protein